LGEHPGVVSLRENRGEKVREGRLVEVKRIEERGKTRAHQRGSDRSQTYL
jgi:hypothetical protein